MREKRSRVFWAKNKSAQLVYSLFMSCIDSTLLYNVFHTCLIKIVS